MLDTNKPPEGLNIQRSRDDLPAQNKNDQEQARELVRSIRISPAAGRGLDSKTINYGLYNSFNYSLFLPDDYKTVRLCLGVTSPNEGEGKTTAICNLATAISLGIGRKTLVVDLNPNNPRIHDIFKIPRAPGVAEAMAGGEICVVPTQIENLYAMPAGSLQTLFQSKSNSFRGMLSALSREFEFIFVDLPSVNSKNFPTLIANQLTGLIVVVKPRKTKRRDMNKLFRRVREETVLAFVMNEVNENDF